MQLSIALPCYNEEAAIRRTVEDTSAWLDSSGLAGEIVAVDDGSTDRTATLLEDLARSCTRLRVVSHTRNQGYGPAVRTGLDAGSGEWIAFMDSDGQFRPYDFDRLLAEADDETVVIGRRVPRADPLIRRLNARGFRLANRLLFGVRVEDINCAMKIIPRQVWPRIRPSVTTGALFNLELFARMRAEGIKWRQVDVNHRPRTAGSATGARPDVILRAAWEMIVLRFRLQR